MTPETYARIQDAIFQVEDKRIRAIFTDLLLAIKQVDMEHRHSNAVRKAVLKFDGQRRR